MKLNKIPSFPVYVLLIPIVFVWHRLNEYFNIVDWTYGLHFLWNYILLSLFLVATGKLLFRDWRISGIWTFLIQVVLIFWGAIHDFLKSSVIPSFFSSYTFLLPTTAVSLLLFTVWLKRKKPTITRLSLYFHYTILLWLVIEVFTTAINFINRKHDTQHNLIAGKHIFPPTTTLPNTLQPDIFYIIFDEYASSASLLKNLKFDNSKLESLLDSNKFRSISNSTSNYNITPYSVSSSLNMNYLSDEVILEKMYASDILKIRKTVGQTLIPKLLSHNGYDVKNFSQFNLPNIAAPYGQLFEDIDESVFFGSTMKYRIDNEIGWWFRVNIFGGVDSATWRRKAYRQLEINESNFSSLITELQKTSSTARFVYAHLLIPHSPFLIDSNGNRRIPGNYEDRSAHADSLYLNQLRYANKWIDSILVSMHVPSTRPRVVIIQGDHGRRKKTPKSKLPILNDLKSFEILNAVYFSDGDYSAIHDSLSPVNSFRIVLNKYFGMQLPNLPDKKVNVYQVNE